MRIRDIDIDLGDDGFYRYEGQPFTGIIYELDDSDRLVSESGFKGGLEDGITRVWSPDGSLTFEGAYKFNNPHGKLREWSAGKLVSEANFECGVCLSKRTWGLDGTILTDYQLNESDIEYWILEAMRQAFSRHRDERDSRHV